MAFGPSAARASAIGYSLTITTAYSAGDPFPNRLDDAFVEPDTGFFEVTNTGNSAFAGVVATIAVSSFAGDLSYTSGSIVLLPGASVSVAIPDDSGAGGGFNGPYYFYRPGVEIFLTGTISGQTSSEAVALETDDADIQSGVWRTDPFGLATDSFVLQGGDPWGFNTSDPFALSQAYGVYTFTQPGDDQDLAAVPEPGSAALLAGCLVLLLVSRPRQVSDFLRGNRQRQHLGAAKQA